MKRVPKKARKTIAIPFLAVVVLSILEVLNRGTTQVILPESILETPEAKASEPVQSPRLHTVTLVPTPDISASPNQAYASGRDSLP